MCVLPPPQSGYVDEVFLNWNTTLSVFTDTRRKGMQLLYPCWSSFYHIGDVPPLTEAAACYKPAGPSLDPELFSWTPRWGENDEAVSSDHAVPCAAAKGATAVELKPITWLIDSGSPLDLIDRSRTKACEHLIQGSTPVHLETANGELIADRELPLRIATGGKHLPSSLAVDSRCSFPGSAYRR